MLFFNKASLVHTESAYVLRVAWRRSKICKGGTQDVLETLSLYLLPTLSEIQGGSKRRIECNYERKPHFP